MGTKELIENGLRSLQLPCEPAVLSPLLWYAEELERWNRRINLTGRKAAESIITDLIYDALYLCSRIRFAGRIVDLGSGAGILAIPMAIIGTGEEILSVDRSEKRIDFQRHVKRSLALSRLVPLSGDIRAMEPLGVDLLAAKAVASVAAIVKLGTPHLRSGGLAYLVRGRTEEPPEAQGYSLLEASPYRLPGGTKEYQLFVYKKI